MTPENTKDFITVTSGVSGFFAVHMWWNSEGFWELVNTGIGRYATKEEAEEEAKEWAESQEMDYR